MLIRKLLIQSGYRLIILNQPKNFIFPVDNLPSNIEISDELNGKFDLVLLFVHSKEDLGAFSPKVIPLLEEDAKFWVAYPKKSSKIKTNISRDEGWEILHKAGYDGVSLISIDNVWSAMRFRKKELIKRRNNGG